MQIEYDEKGKLFTEVISKDKVWSYIQTETHYIHGYVHVRVGDRLSDELNKENSFLAVTDAEIYSPAGEQLYSTGFLAVNRRQIIWVMPIEQQAEDQSGTEQFNG